MQIPRKQVKFSIKKRGKNHPLNHSPISHPFLFLSPIEKHRSANKYRYLRITLERIKLRDNAKKKKKRTNEEKDANILLCEFVFATLSARRFVFLLFFFKRVARDNGALRCIAILEQWGIALHPALILPLSADGRRCTSVLDAAFDARE